MVLQMLVSSPFNHLMQLLAQEYFIELSRVFNLSHMLHFCQGVVQLAEYCNITAKTLFPKHLFSASALALIYLMHHTSV
jgi:hypothetical protein